MLFSYSQENTVHMNVCMHGKHCLPYLLLGLDLSISYAKVGSLCDIFISVTTLSIFTKK